MSEWLSYGLSDFLLFSPRTYYRLFELYNAAIWPAHLVALALGLLLAWLLARGGGGRTVGCLLAAAWLWVALAFHAQRYATINWAAVHFAAVFALQGALLLVLTVAGRLALRPPADMAGRFGFGLFLYALLAQPLLGPLFGRSWRAVELFGLAPDPTAVGTLGALLLASGAARWALMAAPLLWCAVSGATAWAMVAPDAWATPLVALLALLAAAAQGRLRRRT